MTKRAIVSVITKGHDYLKDAPRFSGWDTIMFTDQDFKNTRGWDIRKIRVDDDPKLSRYYKWMTHYELPYYDQICYIDGSMTMRREPDALMWFTHPTRRTVAEEANRCIELQKADRHMIMKQWKYYKENGFEDNMGLFVNGFFVRRHSREMNEMCDMVWDIIRRFTHRDQLALPYVLQKSGVLLEGLKSGHAVHRYVTIHNHLK